LHAVRDRFSDDIVKSRYPLDTLAPVPALRSNPSGDLGLAGATVGRGEGSVLLGAVMADGMDPDDLPIAGDLHGAGHDGYLDLASSPTASDPIARSSERDRAGRVDDPDDGHARSRRAAVALAR
jgi:hypothetical protein